MNDERKYKKFHLGDFCYEERAIAIIDFLNLDGEKDTLIENNEYYRVNPRTIKQGTSPQEYKRIIQIFKTLLTKQDIIDITSVIELDKNCSQQTRDNIYKKLDKKINRKVNQKKDDQDIKLLEKQCSYVSNILYHLLDKTEQDHILCYKEAWFNKKIKDRRREWDICDYEYLVLTDSEADNRARDSLMDGEIWRMQVSDGGLESSLEEWVDDVLNIDGRASELNHYDGTEEMITVNGTDYYLYLQDKNE